MPPFLPTLTPLGGGQRSFRRWARVRTRAGRKGGQGPKTQGEKRHNGSCSHTHTHTHTHYRTKDVSVLTLLLQNVSRSIFPLIFSISLTRTHAPTRCFCWERRKKGERKLLKLALKAWQGFSRTIESESERDFLSWMSNGAKLALIFPSGDPPLHCYTCFLFWHRGGHAGTRVWRVRHPPPYSHLARPQGWSSSSRQKSIASHVVDHNFAKKRRERHTFLRKTPATDNSTTITTTYFRRRLIVMLRGMAVSRNGQLVSVVVAFINSDV